MTTDEAADRLAIRVLVDAYAFCADARDAEGQMALSNARAPQRSTASASS